MGVIFDGEQGMQHCKGCDSPELDAGEINPYGFCFGCSNGDEEYGKPVPGPDHPYEPLQPDPRLPSWMRSGRHG